MTKKVFISYTSEFKRFPENRTFVDAAVDAVASADLLSGNMKMFSSVPNSAASLCIKSVQACDILVMLVGFRYGSPVRGMPEVSYVQLEYKTARDEKMPVLVFMLSDEASGIPGKMFIDTEYGHRQKKFREELLQSGDFTCTKFKSPDELQRLIVQALNDLESSKATTETTQSKTPEKRLIRPLQHKRYLALSFMGRETELLRLEKEIRQSLKSGTSLGLYGLRGLGGVGKSALAAELADHLSEDQDLIPGGVLWTNLLEETPEDAAARWLRSYDEGLNDVQISDPIERLHELISERRPLIILDNAQSREQVEKLLVVRAGVINLITTRELSNLPPEIDTHVVEGLAPGEAFSLLKLFAEDMVEEDKDSAQQICKQCGYLPIFLRVAGAAIKSGEYDQLGDYAEELYERGLTGLADHDQHAANVFELSWEKLAPMEREVFSAASFFPGEDFGENFVQSYTQSKRREARRILTRLENASLLIRAGDRYSYHDRVREFARGKWEPVEKESLGQVKRCWTDWTMVESELNKRGAFELSRQYYQLAKDIYPDSPGFGPWFHFVRSRTHTFAGAPELFFQQAFNEPRDSPVAIAAKERTSEDGIPAQWLEWVNRPEKFYPPACLQSLSGHKHFVYSVAYHPDGRHVLSGSADGTLRLWDLETGECVNRFRGHEDIVTSVAFTSDGEIAVSASFDRTLRVWNVREATCEQVLRGHLDRINAITLCGDLKIASASHDRTIRIWDLRHFDCELLLQGHSNWVTAVAWLKDKNLILSGSWDRTIKIWDLDKQACHATLTGHTSGVECIAVRHDENQVATGARDGEIRIWDSGFIDSVASLNGHRQGVRGLAYSHDGNRLVSASWDKSLRMWNIESEKTVAIFESHTQRVEDVSISGDDRFAVSCSRDKTIREWDLDCTDDTHDLEEGGHTMRVGCLRISPDKKLIVSGSDDSTIRLWNVDSRRSITALEGHSRGITSLAINDSSELIASASKDLTVRVWRRHDQTCVNTLMALGTVLCLDFVRDNMIICGSVDAALRLWNFETGRNVAVFEGHKDSVEQLAVSKDFTSVISISRDGVAKVWDINAKRCTETLSVDSQEFVDLIYDISPYRAKMSVDGFNVVKGANEEIVTRYPGQFESVTCSNDGQIVATGNSRGVVAFYQLRRGMNWA